MMCYRSGAAALNVGRIQGMKEGCEPWRGKVGFFRGAPLFIGPALGVCSRAEDYACFLYVLQFSADMDLQSVSSQWDICYAASSANNASVEICCLLFRLGVQAPPQGELAAFI